MRAFETSRKQPVLAAHGDRPQLPFGVGMPRPEICRVAVRGRNFRAELECVSRLLAA
jgi:hypothetical protein